MTRWKLRIEERAEAERAGFRPRSFMLVAVGALAACSGGGIRSTVSQSVHAAPLARPAASARLDAGLQPLAPGGESTWAARLRALTKAPYLLEMTTDASVSSTIDLLGAARQAGFDAVEVARGAEVVPVEAHASDPGMGDELLLIFQNGGWSLDWWARAQLKAEVRSAFTTGIGSDVGRVVSQWIDAPCALAVSATADAPLSAILDGVTAVTRGHPCTRGFAFGLFANPPYVNSTQWAPGPDPNHREKTLTLRFPVPSPVQHSPVVRERRDVLVGAVVEHWQIRWEDPPLPLCMESWGCICAPFGHSQHGRADLVRARAGKPDEVFSLSQIYDPGLDTPPRGLSEAILPAWPTEPHDFESTDAESISVAIQARKLLTLMNLRDYDHDGQATEFILPIGGVGCVFHHFVAVGLSKKDPRLHILGTAEHPDVPLRLSASGWEILRRGAGTYIESPCGNHGSEEQIEVALRPGRDGIRGTTMTYACPRQHGRLLSRKAW